MIGESNIKFITVVRNCKVSRLARLVTAEPVTYTVLFRFTHPDVNES